MRCRAGFARDLLVDDGGTLRFLCFHCRPGPVRAGFAALRRGAPKLDAKQWAKPGVFGPVQKEALKQAAEAAGRVRALLEGRAAVGGGAGGEEDGEQRRSPREQRESAGRPLGGGGGGGDHQ